MMGVCQLLPGLLADILTFVTCCAELASPNEQQKKRSAGSKTEEFPIDPVCIQRPNRLSKRKTLVN